MKFSMIFEGVDKASKVMRKIMAMEKKMAGGMKGNSSKAARQTAKASSANKKLARSMDSVKSKSTRAFRAITNGAKTSARAISRLHRKSVALGKKGFNQIKNGAAKLKNGLADTMASVFILYSSAALAANKLLGTASSFEKFQTILETTTGSAAGAKQAMKWVTDFAVTTPYELDKVTEAYLCKRSRRATKRSRRATDPYAYPVLTRK